MSRALRASDCASAAPPITTVQPCRLTRRDWASSSTDCRIVGTQCEKVTPYRSIRSTNRRGT